MKFSHGAEIQMRHLVIDTDIGTDVDDAIALLQIIGDRNEIDLSITTVYGDVKLRAEIADQYCKLARTKIAIHLGAKKTLSGKEVWVSGLEGSVLTESTRIHVNDKPACDHLFELTSDLSKRVSILAIGPLTNIAEAVMRDPQFPSRVEHLYVMGGRFAEGKSEHNILSDVSAAKTVFDAGFTMSVVGIEITSQVKMFEDSFQRIKSVGEIGQMLVQEIGLWRNLWGRDWITPHDSIAYLMFSRPELFLFSAPGQIHVNTTDGEEHGRTYFTKNSSGTHRIVQKLNLDQVLDSILSGIEGVKFLP
jgi:purine nucleosidase